MIREVSREEIERIFLYIEKRVVLVHSSTNNRWYTVTLLEVDQVSHNSTSRYFVHYPVD